MNPVFGECISSEEELEQMRPILGAPGKLAAHKVIHSLDHHCREFITKSPFLVISTADSTGLCDASPRGDAPGFVMVLDDHHLVIPERPGNRRMDSIRNIIANPQIGLLFLIPGLEETFRINGKAWITRDQQLLKRMEANGRTPHLGIGVRMEEGFVHCAKSLKRSKLWNQSSWLPKESLPSIPQMLADHVKLPSITAKEVEEQLQESYTKRLY